MMTRRDYQDMSSGYTAPHAPRLTLCLDCRMPRTSGHFTLTGHTPHAPRPGGTQ
jgi:hypothetical protein